MSGITTDDSAGFEVREETFSGTGTVIDSLDCINRESLNVEITGVNDDNQIDVMARISDGTFKTIWSIVGNTEAKTINVNKFDELQIDCSVFSSGGSGTLTTAVHDSNIIDEFETTKLEVTEGSITYTAIAKQPNVSENKPIWQVKREFTSGGLTTTQYADCGYYTQDFSARNTIFPPAPVLNTKSILVDGVNELMSVANDASIDFDGTGAFTISNWLKKIGGTTQTPWGKLAAGTLVGYANNMTNAGATVFLIQAFGSLELRKTFTFDITLDANWHHHVVTYDGSQDEAGCKYYVDGVEQTTTVIGFNTLAASISNTAALGLGGVPTLVGTFPWAGNIDNSSIWGAELTSAQVTELYNAGKPMDPTLHSLEVASPGSLISWWRMGDASGDVFPTIVDNVGSNDGTLTNMEAGDIVEDVP